MDLTELEGTENLGPLVGGSYEKSEYSFARS